MDGGEIAHTAGQTSVKLNNATERSTSAWPLLNLKAEVNVKAVSSEM
jgi:hypothetical protein